MDLDPTLWDISKHETHINAAEFSFTAKRHKDGKEDAVFPSTCHAEVPGKILSYQAQSGRARGSQELNPSPRAAEPNSRQSTTRGAGEASQKQGTTARSRDSAVHGWGEETAKRSREQKPRPWRKESLFWRTARRTAMAAELRGRAVKHRQGLSRETRESASLEIFRTQLD